jgi:hypothetical protein
VGGVEAFSNVRRSYGPGIAGLVASHATAAICAQILEKGIAVYIRWPRSVHIRKAPRGIREFLKGRYQIIFAMSNRQSGGTREKKYGD